MRSLAASEQQPEQRDECLTDDDEGDRDGEALIAIDGHVRSPCKANPRRAGGQTDSAGGVGNVERGERLVVFGGRGLRRRGREVDDASDADSARGARDAAARRDRSEEHTSELQSPMYL